MSVRNSNSQRSATASTSPPCAPTPPVPVGELRYPGRVILGPPSVDEPPALPTPQSLPRGKSDDSVDEKGSILPTVGSSNTSSEEAKTPRHKISATTPPNVTPQHQQTSASSNSTPSSIIAQNSSLRSSAPEYRPKQSPLMAPRTPPQTFHGAPTYVFDPRDLPPNAPPSHAAIKVPASTRQRTPPLSERDFGYDFILVLDFEATCEEPTPPNFLPEIIEFPVVVIDINTRQLVGEFHSFVRPAHNAVLSPFCKSLTGITQQQVDLAPTLPEVVRRFEEWHKSVIPCGKTSIFATDGPWDLRDFMYRYSVCEGVAMFPPLFFRWLDVKESFAAFFNCRHGKIQAMLEYLGLGEFEGRLHSGLDDARNIARIIVAMLDRGCTFPRLCEISDPEHEQPWTRHRKRADSTNSHNTSITSFGRQTPPAQSGGNSPHTNTFTSPSQPSPTQSQNQQRTNHLRQQTRGANTPRRAGGNSPEQSRSGVSPPSFLDGPDATALMFHRLVNSSSQQFPSLPSAHDTFAAGQQFQNSERTPTTVCEATLPSSRLTEAGASPLHGVCASKR